MKNAYIDNTHLALWNPRFETIDALDFDYIKHFKENDLNYTLEKELDTIVDLYISDIKSFKELFKSINEEFYPDNEKIQLLENGDNYIVIEGNRRISCVKIINNYDKYLYLLKNFEEPDYINFKNEYYQNKNKFYKFLKENINIINQHKIILKESDYIILSNNQNISNSLFKKHLPGESIGYSSWNKGKYYYDIWMLFNNEKWTNEADLEEHNLKISKYFNKNYKKIYTDYKTACWIIQVISNGNKIDLDELKNKMINLKPSGIEKQFILETFKNIFHALNREDLNTFLNLSFNETTRQWINNGKWEIDKIIEFINKLIDNNLQTTRQDVKKNNEILNIFNETLSFENIEYTQSEFLKAFPKLSYSSLWIISDRFKDKNVKELILKRINQFRITRNIHTDLKVEWLTELIDQIAHNSDYDKSYYVNAISSAIRTINESICKLILLVSIMDAENYFDKETVNDFKKINLPDIKEKDLINHLNFSLNEDKNEIISAFLLDNVASENNKKYLNTIFKKITSLKNNKLDRFSKLKENKLFLQSFNKIFKNYKIDEYYDFLHENTSPLNIFIHKTYLISFDKTIKLWDEIIQSSILILNKFLNIIHHLNQDYINKLINTINNIPDLKLNKKISME